VPQRSRDFSVPVHPVFTRQIQLYRTVRLIRAATFSTRFSLETMSVENVGQQQPSCGDCGGGVWEPDDIPACRQLWRSSGAHRAFFLDAELRRRINLHDDDDEDEDDEDKDCDCAVSSGYSEYSDDYTSMSGSGTSTSMLPVGAFDDRLASLSVSSGDSFFLYDQDDDDDRCSISTLENVDDGEDWNATETTNASFHQPLRSGSVEVEDMEFGFIARTTTTNTVCRSASLKSTYGTTPPSSPRTKKVVRFADALGLDLESIRHILEVGDAPPASLGCPQSDVGRRRAASTKLKLFARFSEPGSSVNFLRRVQERKVSLEEISVDAERLTISGIIRVANIAYQKQVNLVSNCVYQFHAVGFECTHSFSKSSRTTHSMRIKHTSREIDSGNSSKFQVS